VFYIIENYFESIDSIDKAYFLGFILCDSNIKIISPKNKRLDISIHPDDHKVLNLFCHYIKCDKLPKICYSHSNERNITYKRYRLLLHNQKIVDDLVNNFGGCLKDDRLKYNVPKQYLSHFIRGVFDADGGISSWIETKTQKQRYELSISGRYELLNKILEDINWINKVKIKPDKSVFRFRTTNINLIIEFFNYIYNNCNELKLKRKYNIAQQIFSLPQVKHRGKSVKAEMPIPRGAIS
jgi:hypothetical protein